MSRCTSAVTRRDFLDGMKLAAGSVLMSGANPINLMAGQAEQFNGPGGSGDYAGANGNTYDVVMEGHKIRDGAYARVPSNAILEAGRFDCIVVGGGISGLAAALFFQRQT